MNRSAWRDLFNKADTTESGTLQKDGIKALIDSAYTSPFADREGDGPLRECEVEFITS